MDYAIKIIVTLFLLILTLNTFKIIAAPFNRMVNIKARHIVKPAVKTPSGLMYLPATDQLMPMTHATVIYFYKSKTVSDLPLSSITLLLTTSLSKALSVFHPLSGRLQFTSWNRLQLNLNSAGALLIEAESTKSVEDFGDFCPTPEIRELIPSVDYSRPIHEIPPLIVQITKFSCGGVCLGLGIQHTVADGQAAFHFQSEWARIARGESPNNLPFLERSILNLNLNSNQTETGFELDTPQPVLIDGPGLDEQRRKETTVVMLKLTKDQIVMLKKMANEDPHSWDKAKPFTRFEALAAHMWRCISVARCLRDEQPTRLNIVTNFRGHIDPPLPKNYFGNAVLEVTTDIKTDDLLWQPLGDIARKVREVINKRNNEYVRSVIAHHNQTDDFNKLRYINVLDNTQGAFLGNPNLSITSWLGLINDGLDFGWGKEIYMGPGLVGYDSEACIFSNYTDDEDDIGSIMIVLRLEVTQVDVFIKQFYQNLSNM